MNPHSFSLLGYLSVLLWLAVPALWLMRRRFGLPEWLALAIAILSLVFATINSRTHVNRIMEAKAPIADQLEVEAAKRKAVQKARGADVADIRFAEDGANDFIDKAGLNDDDRKYLNSLEGDGDPAWKKNKKTRGSTTEEDSGIDEKIGSEKAATGVSSDAIPTDENKRPDIVMTDAEKVIANRLDGINLTISRLAILLCIVMLIKNYLTSANIYASATFPLPIPASWRNSFTPLPTVIHRPQPPRRSLVDELAWITRRGEVFVCFTKDAAQFPDALPRLGKSKYPLDLLNVAGDLITDTFIFESLWYGRCCFVVDSPQRAKTLFTSICSQLEERQYARAVTNHSVHLVWNLDQILTDENITGFERIASGTGFSLFVCHESNSN